VLQGVDPAFVVVRHASYKQCVYGAGHVGITHAAVRPSGEVDFRIGRFDLNHPIGRVAYAAMSVNGFRLAGEQHDGTLAPQMSKGGGSMRECERLCRMPVAMQRFLPLVMCSSHRSRRDGVAPPASRRAAFWSQFDAGSVTDKDIEIGQLVLAARWSIV
jgi:hypothetical protein